MTCAPMVRISRISFQTDMTRAGAPVIPVARVLESVWPDTLRWVGLIGRTRFTPVELDHMNLETWSEFSNPRELLARLWDAGWNSAWGETGEAIQKVWARSALMTETTTLPGLLPEATANDPEAILEETDNLLFARIMAEGKHLIPALFAPVVAFAPRPQPQPTTAKRETALATAA